MNKALSVLDKVMFGALLVLVIFIPYSSAMVQAGLFVMMLAWIIQHVLVWKTNGYKRFLNNEDIFSTELQWPLLFLGVLIILSLPWSQAPALTLKKFFSRFMQQIILMCLVKQAITTPKRLYQLMAVLLWTLLVVGIDILIQYWKGQTFIFHSEMLTGDRVTGPMRHPNDLGTLLVMVLPIVLALIVTRKSWVPLILGSKWTLPMTVISVVLFTSLLIALGLTSSRGAWLAFVLISIGWSLYVRKYQWTLIIAIVLGAFLLFFGWRCIVLRTDIGLGPSTNASFQTKVLLNPSRRFEYWHTATEVIKRHPFFGCGYNAYIQTLKKLELFPQEYPHNSLFHITAELGLLGLAGYLWLWIVLFFKGSTLLKEISSHYDLYLLGSGIYFSLLGWLIHSFTDTAWESLLLSFFWWLLVGVFLSLKTVGRGA